MKISGEESAEAVRSWAKDEVSKGPTVRYELGRVLFGVSTALGGIVIGLERLADSPALDLWLGASLVLMLLSILIALLLAVPAVTDLNEDHDLFDLHAKQVARVQKLSWIWFGLWVAGLVPGGVAVL